MFICAFESSKFELGNNLANYLESLDLPFLSRLETAHFFAGFLELTEKSSVLVAYRIFSGAVGSQRASERGKKLITRTKKN